MPLDKEKFSHRTGLRVRNYEVDWQGIVHNAVYLYYFETGRIAYLEEAGVRINLESIRNESMIVVARNEVDYLLPARFGQTLDVYSRISYIRHSSFAFEGIMEDRETGKRVGENVAIHVWLDRQTGRPKTIQRWFREAVGAREGENAVISWPSEEG